MRRELCLVVALLLSVAVRVTLAGMPRELQRIQ
jgi:hypothetical protein